MNLPLAAPAPTRGDAPAPTQRTRSSAGRGDDFAAVLGSQVDRRSDDRASRRSEPVRDDARAVPSAARRDAGLATRRDDARTVPSAARRQVGVVARPDDARAVPSATRRDVGATARRDDARDVAPRARRDTAERGTGADAPATERTPDHAGSAVSPPGTSTAKGDASGLESATGAEPAGETVTDAGADGAAAPDILSAGGAEDGDAAGLGTDTQPAEGGVHTGAATAPAPSTHAVELPVPAALPTGGSTQHATAAGTPDVPPLEALVSTGVVAVGAVGATQVAGTAAGAPTATTATPEGQAASAPVSATATIGTTTSATATIGTATSATPTSVTATPDGGAPATDASAAVPVPGSPAGEATAVVVPARLAHIAASLAETVPTAASTAPAQDSAAQATTLPLAADTTAARLTPSGLTPVAAASPLQPTGGPAPTSAPSAPMPSTLPERAVATQLTAPITSLRAVGNGDHVMVVRVSPDTIGPVRVRAHLGADGVRIELLGATEAAREALKVAMPDLRRDLIAAGFPADMSLSTGRQSTGSETAWAGGGSTGDPRTPDGRPTARDRGAASSDPDPGARPPLMASGLRGLDITV